MGVLRPATPTRRLIRTQILVQNPRLDASTSNDTPKAQRPQPSFLHAYSMDHDHEHVLEKFHHRRRFVLLEYQSHQSTLLFDPLTVHQAGIIKLLRRSHSNPKTISRHVRAPYPKFHSIYSKFHCLPQKYYQRCPYQKISIIFTNPNTIHTTPCHNHQTSSSSAAAISGRACKSAKGQQSCVGVSATQSINTKTAIPSQTQTCHDSKSFMAKRMYPMPRKTSAGKSRYNT